jgi:hypothetical protein
MDKIGEQLPALGITAASLTLVFLGFLFASWEAYAPTARASVRSKFRRRGWLALVGIASALASALLGLIGIATSHAHPSVDQAGVALLGVWGLLVLAQSIGAVLEIEK